ncbi:MAG: dienelactone hydrolase family protein [Chloroflexota bacterium]|nr:dienelactone hydrolase family protein [Chloroflexota bacterium]
MWNTFRTDVEQGIVAGITSIAGGGGDSIHAYVARPDGPGPYPGVVLVHHLPGWDEFYQEFTRRFANHGLSAICPDLYCRDGHGTPDDVAAKVRAEGGVADDRVVADCDAAMRWLKDSPTSNGKVGIIGTCSGGRHAVLTASRMEGFGAVADLWGGGVVASPDQLNERRPVAPIDLTPNLNAPLIGLFGNEDQSPSPAQVDQHEAALQAHSKTYTFHRYDGAGHGFFYYDRPAYRPQAAMDGWNKVVEFFNQYLT